MRHAVTKKHIHRNITGHAVQRIRLAASPKVTQDDLAGRLARQGLRLNQSQIAKIENGERPILDFEIVALAKALKVPIQALFE